MNIIDLSKACELLCKNCMEVQCVCGPKVIYKPIDLSRRDYFAVEAMKLICADVTNLLSKHELIAEVSVKYADALIEELDKNE